jgi:hypothetical protein
MFGIFVTVNKTSVETSRVHLPKRQWKFKLTHFWGSDETWHVNCLNSFARYTKLSKKKKKRGPNLKRGGQDIIIWTCDPRCSLQDIVLHSLNLTLTDWCCNYENKYAAKVPKKNWHRTAFSINVINLIQFVRFVTNHSGIVA